MWCYISLGVAFAYCLVDVNYFLRSFIIAIGSLIRPKTSLLDTSVVYGVTLPSDVDFVLDHMNNARVFREFDFGRCELFCRTKLWRDIFSKGGGFPINANFIRYRLPIKLFSVYKVETRITYWNAKDLFLEQKLITLHDGITRAIAYPKITCYNFVGDEKFKELYPEVESPEFDSKMQIVNEISEITSENLKAKCVNNNE